MRFFPFAALFLSAVSLTSCTKEAFFNDAAAGTVLELGFAWNEAVESCLDSDDHSAAYCGSAQCIRYVYNPTSRSVTMFLEAGTVTLEWNAAQNCLEGDLLDRDYLTVCAGTTPAPAP